jgi:hypothetical protein
MASCAYCRTTILFGGKRAGDLRYCSDKCLTLGGAARTALQIPPEILQQHVWAVHQGNCPSCGGRGPIDVHMSYRVWSALIITQWSSRPTVSCQACGTKVRLKDAGFCLLLGWWGFPWGLLLTPVQIGRNLVAIFSSRDPSKPSPELNNLVAAQLAKQMMGQH